MGEELLAVLEAFDPEPVTWRTYTYPSDGNAYGEAAPVLDATVPESIVVHPRRPQWGEDREDATRQYEQITLYTRRPEPVLADDRPPPEVDYQGRTFSVDEIEDYRTRCGIAVVHASRELTSTP